MPPGRVDTERRPRDLGTQPELDVHGLAGELGTTGYHLRRMSVAAADVVRGADDLLIIAVRGLPGAVTRAAPWAIAACVPYALPRRPRAALPSAPRARPERARAVPPGPHRPRRTGRGRVCLS